MVRRSAIVGLVVALIVAALLIIQPWSSKSGEGTRPDESPSSEAARLTRQDNELLLDGEPFRYVGVNAYGLNGQETGYAYDQEAVDSLFSALPRPTLTRTWAWSKQRPESLKPILESAERHGQLLILSLSEGAEFGSKGDRTTEWYESGYKKDLLPWVDKVVPMYKDSPAIGMWEIINEPGNLGSTDGDVPPKVMKDFFDTVAARIKLHDPRHLVETGTMDAKQAGMSDWVALNSGDNIDVMSIHEYADEFESGAIASHHVEDVLADVRRVNKPFIIGEVGVRGADEGCVRSRAERVDIVRKKFDVYFGLGASGVNLWNWFPDKRQQCAHGENIDPSDPLMGLLRSYRPSAPQSTSTSSTGTQSLSSSSTGTSS